jgi:hypothetical protein
MLEWQTNDYTTRIDQLHWPPHHAHRLATMQWEYARELCRLCHVHNPIGDYVQPLFDHCTHIRNTDVMNYKNTRFAINQDTFVQLEKE